MSDGDIYSLRCLRSLAGGADAPGRGLLVDAAGDRTRQVPLV